MHRRNSNYRLPHLLISEEIKVRQNNSMKICPSFSAAVEWFRRHRHTFKMMLELVQQHPRLVKEESVDRIWNALVEARLEDEDRRPRTALESNIKSLVFVTGYVPDNDRQSIKALDALVNALLPYCYVRINPGSVEEASVADIDRNLQSANVFIFLLNAQTLESDLCLILLRRAVSLDVPIVMMKFSGYRLPEFSEVIKKAYVSSQCRLGPTMFNHNKHLRSFILEYLLFSLPNFHKKTLENCKMPRELALSDVIRHGYQRAFIYSSEYHSSCIAKLYGRLSDYLGDFFLEKEIRQISPSEPEYNSSLSPSPVYFPHDSPSFVPFPESRHEFRLNTETKTIATEDKAVQVYPRDEEFVSSPTVKQTKYLVFPSKDEISQSPIVVSFPLPKDSDNQTKNSNENLSRYSDVNLDTSGDDCESPIPSPITGK